MFMFNYAQARTGQISDVEGYNHKICDKKRLMKISKMVKK